MKYLIVLISIFGSIGLFAQNSFQYKYDDLIGNQGFFKFQYAEGNYEVFSWVDNTRIYRYALNEFGELTVKDSLYRDKMGITMIEKMGSKYFCPGFQRLVNDSLYKAIHIVNLDFDSILETFVFGPAGRRVCDNTFYDFEKVDNGYLLTSTVTHSPTQSTLCNVSFFNLNGQLVWDKKIGNTNLNLLDERPKGICKIDSLIYISLIRQYGPNNFEFFLQCLGEQGDLIWEKNISDFNFSVNELNQPYELIYQTSQKKSIVMFFHAEESDGSLTDNFLLRLAPDGTLVNYKKFLTDKNITIEGGEKMDEEIYLFGNVLNGYDENLMQIYAMKLNTSLDVDWFNHYGYEGNELITGYNIDPNGKGVLLAGSYLNYQNVKYEPFIVHTDCRGNTTWDYSSCNINESEEELLVFPNPSNGQFNFHLPEKDETQITLKVYDVLGREVYQKKFTTPAFSIDLSQFASATYHYVLSSNIGEIFQGKLVIY